MGQLAYAQASQGTQYIRVLVIAHICFREEIISSILVQDLGISWSQ